MKPCKEIKNILRLVSKLADLKILLSNTLTVQEWYGKWGISPCLQGVTLTSLLRHLSSINEGVQLTALATCGKVISVGIAYLVVTCDEHSDTNLSASLVPQGYTTITNQLTGALEKLLDSESIPVRVGAAIVNCGLGVINNEVKLNILLCAMYISTLDRRDPTGMS